MNTAMQIYVVVFLVALVAFLICALFRALKDK